MSGDGSAGELFGADVWRAAGTKILDGVLDEYRRQLLAKGDDGETSESEGAIVQGQRLEGSHNPNAWNA